MPILRFAAAVIMVFVHVSFGLETAFCGTYWERKRASSVPAQAA
jgi:hypothetical protein